MNDWWNDPPEDYDGEIDEYEPDPPDTDEWIPESFYYSSLRKLDKCPHGNDPVDCDACMRESDFQYDAHREQSRK